MPLKVLVTERKCRQQNVLILSKVESYRRNRRGERKLGLKHCVIRHRVWRTLQEKICRGLEERDRVLFKENCVESERVGM